jgi:hypothetical protein
MSPDLRPIPWVPVSLVPQPEVIEDASDSAWALWDASLRQLEANTPEGRAMRLADLSRPVPLDLVRA